MCWVFLSPQKHMTYSLLIGGHPVANDALASKQAKPAQSRQDTFFPAIRLPSGK